jgi:hypothetical protein
MGGSFFSLASYGMTRRNGAHNSVVLVFVMKTLQKHLVSLPAASVMHFIRIKVSSGQCDRRFFPQSQSIQKLVTRTICPELNLLHALCRPYPTLPPNVKYTFPPTLQAKRERCRPSLLSLLFCKESRMPLLSSCTTCTRFECVELNFYLAGLKCGEV